MPRDGAITFGDLLGKPELLSGFGKLVILCTCWRLGSARHAPNGGKVMTPVACRERARQCVELAQSANREQHRKMLLDMAMKWLQLGGMSQLEIDLIAADNAAKNDKSGSPQSK